MPELPQLYGLLVAINDYQPPVTPLGGCVNDIQRVKTYLETSQQDLHPQLLVLENEAATKQAIVNGFRQHLARAGKGDTILFYFAGHGTQEAADPGLWPYEPDGKLECLVSYDGIVAQDNEINYNLLADKELRYLLHELDQKDAHIITIFDCCHSGGNTRLKHKDIAGEIKSRQYVSSRETEDCPQREWEQFIFADSIDPQDLASRPLGEVIPVGQHVQMGACRSDQQAYEWRGSGIFTATLLSLLESSDGAISYFDLRSRIRYMVKNEFKQTPQVYVQGPRSGQLFSGFLGRPIERDMNEGNFIYNKKEGWILDMGAIHGIAPDTRSISVKDPDGGSFSASVSGIKVSHTLLQISDPEIMTRLDPLKAYRAKVPGAMGRPIRVFLALEDPVKTMFEQEIEGKLLLAATEQESDYVVRTTEEAFSITLPFDAGKPVALPIPGLWQQSAALAVTYLEYIAKWHFARDLYNPNVRVFEAFPLEIRIQVMGEHKRLLPLEKEDVVLPYRLLENRTGGKALGEKITIQIINRFSSALHCSLLYLSESYQIYPRLLEEPVVKLQPGASAWAADGNPLTLDLPDHVRWLQHPNSFVWLKFIVSTEAFDVSSFVQEPLPMPNESANRKRKTIDPTKLRISDWTTRLVQIRMPNPTLDNV